MSPHPVDLAVGFGAIVLSLLAGLEHLRATLAERRRNRRKKP